MTLGIIDLGSNTFHLIIANSRDDSFDIVEKERQFVHLSQYGIEHLNDEVIARAKNALHHFVKKCEEHQVDKIVAFGTETLRRSDNTSEFLAEVQKELGLTIAIIDGQREAELISRGVSLAAQQSIANSLVIDIGGGSTEIILYDGYRPHSYFSLPLGSTVLYNAFGTSDPLDDDDIEALNTYLQMHLSPVFQEAKKLRLCKMIGTSGTFEIIANNDPKGERNDIFYQLRMDYALSFMQKVSSMTPEERELHPGIPAYRSKLMPIAFQLCLYIIRKLNIRELYFSNYAMKEGILADVSGLQYTR